MQKIAGRAFLNALGTTLYIVLVASLIFSLQTPFPKEDTILAPIFLLLLFVSSAAITGFLVLGKPTMLYIDGKKKEAVLMLTLTILILFTLTAIVFGFLLTL